MDKDIVLVDSTFSGIGELGTGILKLWHTPDLSKPPLDIFIQRRSNPNDVEKDENETKDTSNCDCSTRRFPVSIETNGIRVAMT